MTTINTTALARRFGVTTKALEKRLAKLGITPAQELTQLNGRRFILWPAASAVEALEKYKADKLEGRAERPAKTVQADTTATDKLQSEVQELKAMMQTLLEQMQKRD